MRKNELVFTKDTIYRLLDIKADAALIIDCTKKTMPFWETEKKISDMDYSDESVASLSDSIIEINNHFNGVSLNHKQKQIMHERFTMSSDILPLVVDRKKRSEKIQEVSEKYGLNKQTIRKYLCTFLSYQDIRALAPKDSRTKKQLSKDEKNIRWALNKFYYTTKKHSLKTTYRLMLKERYCDSEGTLPNEYPTFHQFRYFYRKTYNKQTALISREGLSKYQRDERPLLGDGVREFFNHVGIGMMDATVCDIYLVDDGGNVIGRPVLTV